VVPDAFRVDSTKPPPCYWDPPPPDYDLNRIPRCAILDVDVRPLTKNIFGPVASGYIKMGARPRHIELESKLEDKLELCSHYQWHLFKFYHFYFVGPKFRMYWDEALNTAPSNLFCAFVLEGRHPSHISYRNMTLIEGL
jgi:hypothetical protein